MPQVTILGRDAKGRTKLESKRRTGVRARRSIFAWNAGRVLVLGTRIRSIIRKQEAILFRRGRSDSAPVREPHAVGLQYFHSTPTRLVKYLTGCVPHAKCLVTRPHLSIQESDYSAWDIRFSLVLAQLRYIQPMSFFREIQGSFCYGDGPLLANAAADSASCVLLNSHLCLSVGGMGKRGENATLYGNYLANSLVHENGRVQEFLAKVPRLCPVAFGVAK